MAYEYDQILAADPSHPERVASQGVVTIFAPGDTTQTPLTITTLSGLSMENPIKVNEQGYGPAFIADRDQVAWAGGGFTGLFVSYKGMKEVAVAAQLAAQEAVSLAKAPTDESVDAGIQRAGLPDLVRRELSTQPDVTEAAANLAKSDAGLVHKSDPRVPSVGSLDDALVAIRDSEGRETWLGARSSDGGPSDWAMHHLSQRLGVATQDAPEKYLFALTDANQKLTDLTIRAADGQFEDFVVDRLRERILSGFSVTPPEQRTYADTIYSPGSEVFPIKADSSRVAGWGSSSMEWGGGTLSSAFTTNGASWYGGGKGGERAEHIAARIGSTPALLTVAGGQMPAAGAVEVTASNMPLNTLLKTYTGTLSGVPGSVSYQTNPARYVFTRAGSGAAVTVPPDTPFIPDAISYRDALTLLWMGKNNMGTSGAVETVIRLTDAAFDWLAPLEKRCLVLGHFADTNSSVSARTDVRAVNAAHRNRYGALFIDVDAYVTGEQVWRDSGLTPTAADLEQQALGNKPASLSVDAGHLSDAAYAFIRDNLITPTIKKLGWY